MKRRTVLRSFAAVVATRPLARLELLAQSPALNDTEITTLAALADVVLPASIGAAGRRDVVDGFVSWVRNYKEGADRGGGYGNANLAPPTGPAPARQYPAQFAALDAAARTRGAASFAALAPADRRAVVEAALETPTRVTRLPGRPNGSSLIADFMGFYYTSADAFDVAYQAEIGRDKCRGLDGSDKRPGPLGGR
jgi:Gluconate 2-dehydrogenase subunit 3